MGRFCSNCGKELNEGAAFCSSCGESVEEKSKKSTKSNVSRPFIPERNIAVSIILSFLTCGFYSLYWLIVMTDESNALCEDETASGAMTILLILVTCGIYSIYWNYKMGQKMYEAGKKHDVAIADNSVLYLVLGLFGFGIVNYCLIQSDLNKFAK